MILLGVFFYCLTSAQAAELSAGASVLALAAPFALPVDWSILDVTLGVVAHQVVMHKRKIVGLFVEPHQGATDLGRVRVDQLGKVADAEAVTRKFHIVCT